VFVGFKVHTTVLQTFMLFWMLHTWWQAFRKIMDL